jgi:hypothetical protein
MPRCARDKLSERDGVEQQQQHYRRFYCSKIVIKLGRNRIVIGYINVFFLPLDAFTLV